MEVKNIRSTNRKIRYGRVVSTKCHKTITVLIEKKYKHPVYGKFLTKTKKFTVHDEQNKANEGDMVVISETRPLSKTKCWRLVKILQEKK